jgi:hypothetical protein
MFFLIFYRRRFGSLSDTSWSHRRFISYYQLIAYHCFLYFSITPLHLDFHVYKIQNFALGL